MNRRWDVLKSLRLMISKFIGIFGRVNTDDSKRAIQLKFETAKRGCYLPASTLNDTGPLMLASNILDQSRVISTKGCCLKVHCTRHLQRLVRKGFLRLSVRFPQDGICEATLLRDITHSAASDYTF